MSAASARGAHRELNVTLGLPALQALDDQLAPAALRSLPALGEVGDPELPEDADVAGAELKVADVLVWQLPILSPETGVRIPVAVWQLWGV